MGYTTEFDGSVEVFPALNEYEINYLKKFSETRRMSRSAGPYFVDGNGYAGQDDGPDTIYDHNCPPPGQPGLWCKWEPTNDGCFIVWNGAEKFYDSAEWMQYLIDHFLKQNAEASKLDHWQFEHFTFDHVLNGTIDCQGEDPEDRWRLIVEDNVVRTQRAKIVWEDE